MLLAGDFEAFEAAAFTDVLGWARDFGSEEIEVTNAGFHLNLKASFALEVIPALFPSGRVVSREVSAPQSTTYWKAGAVNNWLLWR